MQISCLIQTLFNLFFHFGKSEILLKSKILHKLNVLKSKNYCTKVSTNQAKSRFFSPVAFLMTAKTHQEDIMTLMVSHNVRKEFSVFMRYDVFSKRTFVSSTNHTNISFWIAIITTRSSWRPSCWFEIQSHCHIVWFIDDEMT